MLQKLSQILSYTQRFSVSPLTFYKVLLLTPPNMNLIHCDDLNSPALFPSIADEVLHNCSALTGHLRTLCVDLQEIPLGNASFSWFTGASYSKNDNGDYCARHAIATPFDAVEAALSLIITSAQQAELYPLTQACTSANNKTASTYANSRYTFGVSCDFEMWKQHSSVIPIKIKF